MLGRLVAEVSLIVTVFVKSTAIHEFFLKKKFIKSAIILAYL